MAAIGLLALTFAGGWLRVRDLDSRSITHPEMYVPGIPLPDGLSEPRARLTPAQVLTGTFSSDTHPPGYYLAMWAWTRAFGTGLAAMRMPSALLGAACIPLLFWLACLAGQRKAGWIAAACLAFSGYHVFWSRVARMFAMECFLALLAAVLAALLARGAKPRAWLMAAYVVTLLAGLTGHIFFWTVLFTHIAWAALEAWRSGRAFPGVLKAQWLVLVAGSPLLAFAAYQQGNTLAELSNDVWLFAREFLQFAFIFPSSLSGFFAVPPPALGAARAVVLAVSLVLLALGVWQAVRARENCSDETGGGPAPWWWLAVGLAASAGIGGFIWMAYRFATPYRTIQLTKAMLPLPVLLALGGMLLYRLWPRLVRRAGATGGAFLLVAMLALGPFALLSAVSLFKPIFNQRGMLLVAPYLLLLLATGLVWLVRRPLVLAIAGAALAVMLAVSLREYAPMTVDPADYRGFARMLAAEMASDDVVFLVRRYDVTPMLYYLDANRYHLVARDYASACGRQPNSRVWALALYEDDIPAPMKEALAGYQAVKRLEAPYAKAWLFAPRRATAETAGHPPLTGAAAR